MAGGGLHVAIRLSPRARTDCLVGIASSTRSGRVVKAAVAAPAEAGRANEALLRLLARTWDLRRQNLSIVQGFTSRNKVVGITGDPRQLLKKVSAAIAGLPGW